MEAASRPAIIQLEASIVSALKDLNYKWTTPHVKVGSLLLGSFLGPQKFPSHLQCLRCSLIIITSSIWDHTNDCSALECMLVASSIITKFNGWYYQVMNH